MEYVLLGCFREDEHRHQQVLVVKKINPDWQCGRINLPGGKVEPMEDPKAAAIRELAEETGYTKLYADPILAGRIEFDGGAVNCFLMFGNFRDDPQPGTDEVERPYWEDFGILVADYHLMPNLRAIIPLLRANVIGWTIDNEQEKAFGTEHAMTVRVPTYCHPFIPV